MENIVVVSKSKTNPNYGCIPEDRSIEDFLDKGVINLDKPSGPTSHEIDSWVKRILNVEKIGHGGTLDPKVTGVLPIGINQATRVIQLLLSAPKEYVCLMNLHKEIPEEDIKKMFNEFQGKIYQTPPLKSAVKRELRVRNIYYSTIYEINGRDVLFKIGCEAGTYVRTYCRDIGEALGAGAHMAELRRAIVGPFSERENLHTLQDLTDAFYYWKNEGSEEELRKIVMPMEKASQHLPKVIIKDSAVEAICHGANLSIGGIVGLYENIRIGDTVVIETLKGELVASAISSVNFEDIALNKQGIAFNTSKVFMKPGSYPIMWK
ncbi:RNA-guided pseudouridylation complex pseudouridine synthase subunit Cbf5 [Methanobrevibacter curvatus]|uniref:Probable tRNA pseudouridine synthase B n=1 Tax=Methanobrevibacter curvatus TaxID=49547 RepID=A0A162FD15_9EURY|nr:RNA-guided pseudouridylation complex pseudouridine synthase subunit Cbf5 [Methanobrevibacter curvatus]KZX11225.1 tRNA pseudouridine synthase B [Methanobrevibacter curvatus]